MNYKDRTKIIVSALFGVIKPLALAVMLVAVLQWSGLMSSVSFIGSWALLESGLKNASEEVNSDEIFDFQFTIKDLQENKIPFDQYKGKVIFLNLWATWCGPCRAEMRSIQKLYEKVDRNKIMFVMLSIDRDGDKLKVMDYLKKKEFTFPTFMPSGYLPDQLKVPAIPTTFIISKEGKIVKKEVGTMRYDTQKFQKFLESLTND